MINDKEFMNDSSCSSGCTSDCSSCGCDCSGGNSDGAGIPNTITLTMDDDTELTCMILNVFTVKDSQYISVLPIDAGGQPLGMEVYLYKYAMTPNGDPMLDNIEDDDEYTAAAEMFETLMEQARQADLSAEEE